MKREDFFARVSSQLDRAGPRVARLANPSPELTAIPPLAPAQLAQRFIAELERVGGAVHTCASTTELESALLDFTRAAGARRLVSFGKSTFGSFGFERLWRELAVEAWEGGGEDRAVRFRAAAADADIGLSIADLGVAATGTLFFWWQPIARAPSRSCRARTSPS